jgi:hypothetical protein
MSASLSWFCWEREDRSREQLQQRRQAHKEAEAAIARLVELVEKGLMEAEDPGLRECLGALRFRRDELAQEVADPARLILP